jgi:hypothetical protein
VRRARPGVHVAGSLAVAAASVAALFAGMIIAAYVGGEPRSEEGGICTGGRTAWV